MSAPYAFSLDYGGGHLLVKQEVVCIVRGAATVGLRTNNTNNSSSEK